MPTFLSRHLLPVLLSLGILVPGLVSGTPAPDPAQVFKDARAAFDKGDMERAQSLADDLLKDGRLSPQLFELMGHLRYRQGDLGRAALWYARASLFPPPAPELRQNISHIKDVTGNLSFPSNGLRDQFSAWLTRSQWLQLASFAGWTLVFSLVVGYLFVGSGGPRTVLTLVGVMGLAVSVLAALGWWWHPSYGKLNELYFITDASTKAYTAATTTSGTVMDKLPAGSEVRRLTDRGQWAYVEIPVQEGEPKRAWIQTGTMTAFWPFDPGYLE